MIRPLRQRHRQIFLWLGLFLPLAFALGIAARKPLQIADVPSFETAASRHEFTVWERAGLFPKSPVQLRLLRDQKNTGQFAVAFSAAKDFVKPDLLVYWSAGSAAITDALPGNAILLGTFTAPVLPLTDEITKSNGQLVLYSLADGEIVDISKPILLQPTDALAR